MIALDANILIYAHRSEFEWYPSASACVAGLAEGRSSWAIPWPCVHEFFAAVTNPRVFPVPTPVPAAIDQLDALMVSPSLQLLSEASDHWEVMKTAIRQGSIRGPMVHDARIAAICLQHGVTELWTADRDFGRFPTLRTRNPLVG